MPTNPDEHNPDGVIEDEKSLAIKGKVMNRLKKKNMLDAIHSVAMYAGTMVTTATAGVVLAHLFGGIALGATLAPVMAAVAIGAVLIGVAVITDYMSSGIGQGASYDIQEATAHSAAREMRHEFEQANLVVHRQEPQKNWAAQAEAEKLQEQLETTPQRY